MIEKDPALRALVNAIRRANTKGATARDALYVKALASKYRPPLKALDTHAAIDELGKWGTTSRPHEISIELRAALIQFLRGKIKKRRGRGSAPPTALVPKLAALEARHRHAKTGVSLKQAARQVALEWCGAVTPAALDATLYPRKRTRKT